jgi:hypothetical protein
MAELKTTRNQVDVDAILMSVQNEKRRHYAFTIDLLAEATGEQPEMLGTAIVDYFGLGDRWTRLLSGWASLKLNDTAAATGHAPTRSAVNRNRRQ